MLHISAPPGGPLYKRGRGCAPGISNTTPVKLQKVPEFFRLGVATTDVSPYKVPIQAQKIEKSQKLKTPLSMCSGQIIKIVLIMFILGILLS